MLGNAFLVSDRSVGHNERHPVFCLYMLNCSLLSFGNWSVLCCYVLFDPSLPSPPTGTAVVFLSSCVVSMRDWWCARQGRCCRRLDGPVMRSRLSDALSTLSPVRNRTQVNQGNLVHLYSLKEIQGKLRSVKKGSKEIKTLEVNSSRINQALNRHKFWNWLKSIVFFCPLFLNYFNQWPNQGGPVN